MEGWCSETAQFADQTLAIHGADLIEYGVSGLRRETAGHAKRIWMPACRHRCDNEGTQVRVQFVGRNHYTRACLTNFAATSRA